MLKLVLRLLCLPCPVVSCCELYVTIYVTFLGTPGYEVVGILAQSFYPRELQRYVSFVALFKMEAIYNVPFQILEIPNLRLKKPTWLRVPSAMAVFAVILLSYFLVTGGMYNFRDCPRKFDCFVKIGSRPKGLESPLRKPQLILLQN